MNTKKKKSTGMTLGSVLLVVFITLKLCKVISWSWVWVLSPLWISAGLFIIVFIILVIAKMMEK